MSAIKRWYEENMDKLSIDDLIIMGYSKEEAEWLKSIFDY